MQHSGIVVSNKAGDVVMISKFNTKGGLYMHRPHDIQAEFGIPSLYTTNHPAGRFLLPDYTVDLIGKARAGYV